MDRIISNNKVPSETNDMDKDTLNSYMLILRNTVSMVYSMFHSNVVNDIDNKLVNKSIFDIELYVIALMGRWPKETHFCAGSCVMAAMSDYRTVYPDDKLPQYLTDAILNVMILLELTKAKEKSDE